jgi:hypothetical protein
LVTFTDWHEIAAYQRFQRSIVLKGSAAPLTFKAVDMIAGGLAKPFVNSSYRLVVDGTERAITNVTAGTTTRAQFVVDATKVEEGWHTIDIDCGSSGETCPTFWAYFDRGGPARTDVVPVCTGSYDVSHYGFEHRWILLSGVADLKPIARPLPARECATFSDTPGPAAFFRENITPCREGDIHRISKLDNGAPTTFNFQSYFWSSMVSKRPGLPLLDGPRGIGTAAMLTMVQVDRHGGAYCADPWRIFRVRSDGEVVTRCGYRHKNPPSNYMDETPELELVGDWSAIPSERRGFHEIWGFAWDKQSLVLDEAALKIAGESPHSAGPRLFVADSHNNRVLALTFARDSFEKEPVVTEFLTGLSDAWDVVCDAGVLYVAERQAHRIAAYDARTGAYLRSVVQGKALSWVDNDTRFHRVNPGVTQAQIDAEACVGPEGLALQDGWLYYGSKAMARVKRVNLTSGEIQTVCSPRIDANSNFVKIALSDGTFGPRNAVFVSTWSNAYWGMPQAFKPDGTAWGYYAFDRVPRGRSSTGWASLGYSSAVGVGMGRLYCGSSEEGLVRISKVLPDDVDIASAKLADGTRTRLAFDRGASKWTQRGFELLHGHGGYGHYGYALPWGLDPDIDVFLTVHGHTRS